MNGTSNGFSLYGWQAQILFISVAEPELKGIKTLVGAGI
jgi:hypothetical protein